MVVKFKDLDFLYSPELNNIVNVTNIAIKSGLSVNENTTPDMNVIVYLGELNWEQNLISVPQQTLSINNSDPNNDRIDLIVIDKNGICSVVTGNATINPVKSPNYDSNLYYVLAYVYVPAGTTTITNSNIYDKRLVYNFYSIYNYIERDYNANTGNQSFNYNYNLRPFLYANILEKNGSDYVKRTIEGLSYENKQAIINTDLFSDDIKLIEHKNGLFNDDNEKLDITGFNKLKKQIKIQLKTINNLEQKSINVAVGATELIVSANSNENVMLFLQADYSNDANLQIEDANTNEVINLKPGMSQYFELQNNQTINAINDSGNTNPLKFRSFIWRSDI